jgi:hypothetical protein
VETDENPDRRDRRLDLLGRQVYEDDRFPDGTEILTRGIISLSLTHTSTMRNCFDLGRMDPAFEDELKLANLKPSELLSRLGLWFD